MFTDDDITRRPPLEAEIREGFSDMLAAVMEEGLPSAVDAQVVRRPKWRSMPPAIAPVVRRGSEAA